MIKKNNAALVAASVLGGIAVGQALPARAQLGDILVGGGIALLVNKFSGQLDRYINTATGNKPDGLRETTRVVPIISAGKGVYVGAAQISGPKNKVDEVKALAQGEFSTKIGNEVRIRALIPVDTTKPGDITSVSRIKGVGVSAIIDYRL